MPPVSVPYGCLVPASLDGLLAAGRHVSCDAASHSFLREIPQCWLTGQAAGAAAGLSAATHYSLARCRSPKCRRNCCGRARSCGCRPRQRRSRGRAATGGPSAGQRRASHEAIPVRRLADPTRTRTCDLRLRRATLYPTELRVRAHLHSGNRQCAKVRHATANCMNEAKPGQSTGLTSFWPCLLHAIGVVGAALAASVSPRPGLPPAVRMPLWPDTIRNVPDVDRFRRNANGWPGAQKSEQRDRSLPHNERPPDRA